MDVILSQEVIPLHETYVDIWSSEGQDNSVSSTLIYTMGCGKKIDEDADTVTATGDVHHYGDGSVVLEYVNTGITAGAEDKEEPEWSLPF